MGQAITCRSCGWGAKSDAESRSWENEVTNSGSHRQGSRGSSSSCDYGLTPSFPSNQFRGESYSVRVNSDQQSRTFSVSGGDVSEVKSQSSNQELDNHAGPGNHELDNQGSGNQASNGQGR